MTTLQADTPLYLHHLHVSSANPDALTAFYERLFDMKRQESEEGLLAVASGERAMVVHSGTSGEVIAAAYAAADGLSLAKLRSRVGRLAEPAHAAEELFFRQGAFAVTDPQGRRLVFGVPRVPRQPDVWPARLQHTVFQTTALDEVIDFYVNRIGFSISDEVVDDEGQIVTCFLRSDEEHHSIAFFRGSQDVWDHHCYETHCWNDIRDWGDRFAAERRSIFFGPGRHGPGNNLFFMVTDPDGNRVELSAELERVALAKEPGIWPHEEHTLNSWGRGWIRT